MKKVMIALMLSFIFVGCASGGPNSLGSHGKDSTLSENKIEGLYLFKVETNMNQINITSHGDAKVGI